MCSDHSVSVVPLVISWMEQTKLIATFCFCLQCFGSLVFLGFLGSAMKLYSLTSCVGCVLYVVNGLYKALESLVVLLNSCLLNLHAKFHIYDIFLLWFWLIGHLNWANFIGLEL